MKISNRSGQGKIKEAGAIDVKAAKHHSDRKIYHFLLFYRTGSMGVLSANMRLMYEKKIR